MVMHTLTGGTFYEWTNGSYSRDMLYSSGFDSLLFESQNNRYSKKKRCYVSGGDFHIKKRVVNYAPANVGTIFRPHFERAYSGTVIPTLPELYIGSDYIDYNIYGPRAYLNARPDKAEMSGFVALVELRDLHALLAARIHTLNKFRGRGHHHPSRSLFDHAGDASQLYLEGVFGWAPFIKDVYDTIKLTRNIQSKLNQLYRDNGKALRRRRSVFSQKVDHIKSTRSGYEYLMPMGVEQIYATIPICHDYSYTEQKIWFSGRFKYFLPERGSQSKVDYDNSIIKSMYGLKITPSNVWKIIPWSWLADWSGTLGDSLANFDTGTDIELISEYAFLMSTYSQVNERKVTGSFFSDRDASKFVNYDTSCSNSIIFKDRSSIGPFGNFTKDFSGFSDSQIAILTALAISHTK